MISDTTKEALGAIIPMVIDWVEAALAGGKDPVADAKALFATADEVADEAENAKFGPPEPGPADPTPAGD